MTMIAAIKNRKEHFIGKKKFEYVHKELKRMEKRLHPHTQKKREDEKNLKE